VLSLIVVCNLDPDVVAATAWISTDRI